MLRVSRLWTYETRVPYVSQDHWEEQGTYCYVEDDSDNKDDRILNAFTAIVNPTDGIVEDEDDEEDLVDSKFEKMDDFKMLSIQLVKSCIRFLRSMRNYMGWPPKS